MHKTRLEALVKAASQYETARQDEACAEDAAKCAGERIADARRRQDEAMAEVERLAALQGSVEPQPIVRIEVLEEAIEGLLQALPFDVHNGLVVVTGVPGSGFEFVKEPERAKAIRLRLAEREREIRSALLQARRVIQMRKG